MKNPPVAVGYLLLIIGIGLMLYGFSLYPEAPAISITGKGE